MGYGSEGHERSRPRRRRQRGAVLVETAIIAPFIFLLLFGVIEFGWIFYQYQDVRQGAREGARIAAVDEVSDADAIRVATCGRMEEPANTTVSMSRTGSQVGSRGTIVVTRSIDTLTGFLDPILGSTRDVTSTVQFRIEESITWTNDPAEPC
jgi:Flp pilus assembly protein TadG